MKILVTGSSGMLGRDLCDILAKDYQVVGVDIVETGAVPIFYKTDITVAGQFDTVIVKEVPDMVIHAAAWTDVDGCEKDQEKARLVNVVGTHNVAESLLERKIPVIFISTDFVFDGKKGSPYVEDDNANPLSVYGKTKLEAENIIKGSLEDYVIARTSWLYGQGGKNFVDTIISRGRSEEKLKIVDDQRGSPTYVCDLAGALKKLVESVGVRGQKTYHISNSGECSWYGFACEALKLAGLRDKVRVETTTSEELARPATRPRFSVLDNNKFQEATGHKMRSWQEAVREYLSERCQVRGDGTHQVSS